MPECGRHLASKPSPVVAKQASPGAGSRLPLNMDDPYLRCYSHEIFQTYALAQWSTGS